MGIYLEEKEEKNYQAFMDELEVESTLGEGTLIRMQKEIGYNPWIYEED